MKLQNMRLNALTIIIVGCLNVSLIAKSLMTAQDAQRVIADLKTAAEKPQDIKKLAARLNFITPDDSINFQNFHDYLTSIEIGMHKSDSKLSEKQRKELSQYTSKIRVNLERSEQQEFAKTFLEQSLNSLPAAIQETFDLAQAAQKYGYMKNGKIDLDALEHGIDEIERQILGYAALLEERYPGKIKEVKKIIEPQFKIARENITRFKKGKR